MLFQHLADFEIVQMTTTQAQNSEQENGTEEGEVEEEDDVGTDHDSTNDPDELPIFQFFSDDQQPKTEEEKQQQEAMDVLKHEPQQEFVRTKGLSYFAVLLNFLKSLIGAGFLSLPMAFNSAGPWSALALLLVSAVLNWFCMVQLVECTQFHYKRLNISYLSYGNLAKEACRSSFPWMRRRRLIAKRLVNLSILVLEFGFCSTYYLFIAVSLKEVTAVLRGEHEHDDLLSNTRIWLLIIFIPMVLMSFVRSLRILSFFSFVGNVLMVTSLAVIVYVLSDEVMKKKTANKLPPLTFYNGFIGLLLASGTIIFSFEAQTLVLPLEKKLKKPKQMMGLFGILSAGVFVSTIVYVSVGFLGYMSYGTGVCGSITQNLLPKEIKTIAVKLALIVSVCSCFLLQMYVIVEVLWTRVARMIIHGENFKKTNDEADLEQRWWHLPPGCKYYCEFIFRFLMVSVCYAFAAAVPDLEKIIPLVGSTSGMLLAFVYPALIDLFTFVPLLLKAGRRSKAHLRMCQNILLTFVGLFGMVAGLVASILKVAEDSKAHCSSDNVTTSTTSTTFMPNGAMLNASYTTFMSTKA